MVGLLNRIVLLVATLIACASAAPSQAGSSPSVRIRNGTVVGILEDNKVDSFLGIPFAQPPLKNLRLRPPQTITEPFPDDTFYATHKARACPQFLFQRDSFQDIPADIANKVGFSNPIVQVALNISEDCLTINVQRPTGTTSNSRLPILFFVYGGGFELGWAAMYDGKGLVQDSMLLRKEVIYVSVNYRLGGYGFLPGKELAAERSTNLGLRDQRKGLEWVQENIEAFGGDPDKVTLWGESAGAASVVYQSIINGGDNRYNGRPLFRAGIQNSGSISPAYDTTSPKAQRVYDNVVADSPCAGVADSLSCLRGLDYRDFDAAVNRLPGLLSYRSLDITYFPRPDTSDNFFTQSPEVPIQNGQFHKMPIIVGDQEDEGTLFSLKQQNITTNEQLVEYKVASYFPGSPTALSDSRDFVDTFPDQPLIGQPAGSPYRDGPLYNIYPQFKRLAAVLGDLFFVQPRRAYLDYITKQGVPAWSYLATYGHGTPIFGTLHASDLIYSLFAAPNSSLPSRTARAYYINFAHDLDPNVGRESEFGGRYGPVIEWPRWTNQTIQLVHMDLAINDYMADNFRQDTYEVYKPRVSRFRL